MKIVRKDGIEYERVKCKNINYDKKVCIKLSTTQLEEAKEKCQELDISFAELVRRSLDLLMKQNVTNENN